MPFTRSPGYSWYSEMLEEVEYRAARLKQDMVPPTRHCVLGSIEVCGDAAGELLSLRQCIKSPSASYAYYSNWGPCVSLTKKERAQGYCLLGETIPCGSNVGQCYMGYKTCEPIKGTYLKGKWDLATCDGAIGPTPEECDGIDNDCNGLIDDGFESNESYLGTTLEQFFQNRKSCDTKAHLERIKKAKMAYLKECYPGMTRSCGTSTGECFAGYQACVLVDNDTHWSWGDCEGTIGPNPEECDGLDNDCNGVVDDGLNGCEKGGKDPIPLKKS
ncbi:hypothetical protein GF369_02765 [Candidatus Peregrinibacteria bacterium]|nr:hypothetical protein [Candidatus Peregrinibacteria bacterium]